MNIFRKVFNLFRSDRVKKLPAAAEVKLLPPEPTSVPASTARISETPSEETKGNMTSTNDRNPATEDSPVELKYIGELIRFRLSKYFSTGGDLPVPEFPNPADWELPLGKFVTRHRKKINDDAAVLLLIGLTPHIRPDLFDRVIESHLPDERQSSTDFPFIGGVRGKNCRFFLPTGETALFLIAGDDLARRLEVQKLFGAEHIFWEKKILWLEDMQSGEPSMHGRLIMSHDYIDLLTYGTHKSPQFSISFPAKKIAPLTDEQDNGAKAPAPSFDDLVIPDELLEQINEIKSWLTFNGELMDKFGMKHKLKKGYRTLFYGPPGTGKTFTAQILGNDLNKEVYKIDLSMIVSKYIGETEKNLELLFARAEDKDWILFFDEADALFGKRTNVRDAHDKYANQEVSYLLQRIEDYNGLVILATNMKNNIDDAFVRRFNSLLKFPFPDAAQRAQIWKKSLPKNAIFRKQITAGDDNILVRDEPIDIPEAVKKYELTGGNIINVVHYAGIKAVRNYHERRQKKTVGPDGAVMEENEQISNDEPLTIYLSDVMDGIKRELIKEGKPFSA